MNLRQRCSRYFYGTGLFFTEIPSVLGAGLGTRTGVEQHKSRPWLWAKVRGWIGLQ
jgi:hypothetical protein